MPPKSVPEILSRLFPPDFSIYLILILLAYLMSTKLHQRTNKFLPISLLLAYTVFSEGMNKICGLFYRMSNPVTHMYQLVEVISIGVFTCQMLASAKWKKYTRWMTVGTALFGVINALFIEGIFLSPTYMAMIATLMIIIWGAWLFLEQLETPSNEPLYKNPVFIFASAQLIFFTTNYFGFIMRNVTVWNHMHIQLFDYLNLTTNYIYYTLLILAFYQGVQYYPHECKTRK